MLWLLAGCIVAVGAAYFLWPRAAANSSEQQLAAALAAIERGDQAAGAAALDELLDSAPDHPMALLYRGQLAREMGDPDRALACLRRVGERTPKEAGVARFLEGTLLLEQNRARPAERLLLESARLHPTYPQPHERLVGLYAVQLREDECRAQLAALGRLRPWTLGELIVWHLCTGMVHSPQKAIGELTGYVDADPDDAHSRLALARYFLYVDRTDEAIPLLRGLASAADAASRDQARGLLAETLASQSRLAEARALLGDALPAAGADRALWRAHGAYAAAAADWPLAVDCLREALREHPDDLTALYRLGLCLERAGQHEAAEQILQRTRRTEELYTAASRLLGVDPTHSDLRFQMMLQIARLLIQLERSNDALPWLQQAAQVRPADPQLQQLALSISAAGARTGKTAGPRPGATEARFSAGSTRAVPAAPSSPVADDAPDEAEPQIQLVDVHARVGLNFQYFNGQSREQYLLDSTGGGVGVVDYDADGRPDLFFPQGCVVPCDPGDRRYSDRLYRQRGDGVCIDVTARAGLEEQQFGQGCAAGDLDNDGFDDLLVANYGTNVVYHNNGDGTFSDVTAATGIAGERWHSSLALADLDRDGLLDVYAATYVLDPLKVCRDRQGAPVGCSPAVYDADDDRLYHNAGDGAFADVTESAGIPAPDGKGLGVVCADFDDDGWPEIYVSNDGTPNFLYRNVTPHSPGSGLRFEEIGGVSGAALSEYGAAQAGMGIACADLNGDGRLDLYVTNFLDDVNTLYENEGDCLFSDVTRRAGLAAPTRAFLGFGTQALDLDLDGRCELFVANGHIEDRRAQGEPWQMRPQLFCNRGAGRFGEISQKSGEYFAGEYLGRGVARLDWNSDGRPDLVVVHQDRPAALLENQSADCGHRLLLELRGVQGNRNAIGARIRVIAGGRTQVLEVCGGDGYFVTNDHRQCIGLGGATLVDALAIRWPDGRAEQWENLAADAHIVCVEGRPPIVQPLPAR